MNEIKEYEKVNNTSIVPMGLVDRYNKRVFDLVTERGQCRLY